MASTTTTEVCTTPPKSSTMSALERAMQVHELQGEFLSPDTKVEITKHALDGVPGAYILKNVRFGLAF